MKAQAVSQYRLQQGILPVLDDDQKEVLKQDFEALPKLTQEHINRQLQGVPESKREPVGCLSLVVFTWLMHGCALKLMFCLF